MSKKKKEYKRVPGKGGHLFGYSTLWWGSDHLLALQTRQFIEYYRRFYFKDIQAIITCKTYRYLIYNLVLGPLTLLFAYFAISAHDEIFIAHLLFAIPAGVLFLLNLFLGPTCRTHIRTAVQNERIYSLNRFRRVKKFLNQLRPIIENAQGLVSQEQLDDETFVPPADPNTASGSKGTFIQKTSKKSTKLWAPQALYCLMILEAGLSVFHIYIQNLTVSLLSSVAFLCIGILTVIALVQQYESSLKGGLYRLTWVILVFFCVYGCVGYVISIGMVVGKQEIAYNSWAMFKYLSLLSPREHTWYLVISLIYVTVMMVLSGLGFIFLKQHKRR